MQMTTMTATSTPERIDRVTLVGGLTVPLDALQLLWSLESRGLDLKLGADQGVMVGPARSLTEEDRQAIRHHRDTLRALIVYCEEVH